ncbi:30S ribosomal protein S13 [Candidatus Woesearchaeota archaeon]|nr:30S ribosomal protein S13 [Candidatus Woesearchaeota archaeon]
MAKDENFRHLVRIGASDHKGERPIVPALKDIKGVGMPLAHAICKVTKIPLSKRVGDLSESEVEKIEDVIKTPLSYGIPTWMLNRKRDPETGEDKHLIANELAFAKEQDIKLLRKIKCYRGIRHANRLPCRGQRTRSNFRPNKGKVQSVKRKAAKGASKGAGKGGKK